MVMHDDSGEGLYGGPSGVRLPPGFVAIAFALRWLVIWGYLPLIRIMEPRRVVSWQDAFGSSQSPRKYDYWTIKQHLVSPLSRPAFPLTFRALLEVSYLASGRSYKVLGRPVLQSTGGGTSTFIDDNSAIIFNSRIISHISCSKAVVPTTLAWITLTFTVYLLYFI